MKSGLLSLLLCLVIPVATQGRDPLVHVSLAKENRIIKMLLEYDVELYKIDVSGYDDVGSMPKQVFEERKNNASFIDRDNYLLLNLLSAV